MVCARTSCNNTPAPWYNHGSQRWYCASCRNDIEFDSFNLVDWAVNYQPKYGHPMFETKEMLSDRLAKGGVVSAFGRATATILAEAG